MDGSGGHRIPDFWQAERENTAVRRSLWQPESAQHCVKAHLSSPGTRAGNPGEQSVATNAVISSACLAAALPKTEAWHGWREKGFGKGPLINKQGGAAGTCRIDWPWKLRRLLLPRWDIWWEFTSQKVSKKECVSFKTLDEALFKKKKKMKSCSIFKTTSSYLHWSLYAFFFIFTLLILFLIGDKALLWKQSYWINCEVTQYFMEMHGVIRMSLLPVQKVPPNKESQHFYLCCLLTYGATLPLIHM